MPGSIFVRGSDNTLTELRETPYDSESVLQRLLADYPNLLAGHQIDPDNPRRWLLISKEMRVRGDEGDDRGSLDHLFLDQDAVPTLVEVKRSENAQIRREVVGQLLDYAANGVAFWSAEEIRTRFEGTCEDRAVAPDEKLAEFLGADGGQEDFWQRMKTNLQAGRIRLIFVADEIPLGLRRIVEFLNGQMDPAEVLAIEIRQHVGEALTALAPTLIGQTSARLARAIRPRTGRKWDEPSFFADLEAKHPDAVPVARKILEWAKANATRIEWGAGAQSGSFVPVLRHNSIDHQLFAVYTYGALETFFQYFKTKPPFQSENLRLEKLNRLNAVLGNSLPADGIDRRPSFRLSSLSVDGRTEALLRVYEWAMEQIRAV